MDQIASFRTTDNVTGATTYEEAKTFVDEPKKFEEIYPNESSDDERNFCMRLKLLVVRLCSFVVLVRNR